MNARGTRARAERVFRLWVLPMATLAAAVPLEGKGQDTNISVALVGQALIKSDVCSTAPDAFEQARGYLGQVDVAFTNLEVAIAPPGHSLTPRSASAVPAPPVVLDCLKSMGFNLLSLANNHSLDLQQDGIGVTIEQVRERGLAHAGTGADAAAAAAAGILDTPQGKVALVAMATGASQLADPETWAAPGRPGVNYLELLPDGRLNPQHRNRILDAVRAAANESSLVIVYHHNHEWGEPVGSGLPPDRERRIGRFETQPWSVDWAHELIDAGASIYVAHGDPSLHGVEIYKGKLILYGLGNYIFESVGGNDRYGPLAYMSAVATAEFSSGQLVSAAFRPLILSTVTQDGAPRGAPYLAEGAEAEVILFRLVDQSRRHGVTLEVDPATQTAHWRRGP